MNSKITDEQIISLIEGEANPELQQILKNDHEAMQRYIELRQLMHLMRDSKSPEVPEHIGLVLEEAIRREKERSLKQNTFPWLQVAASVAILLIGFVLGKYTSDGISNTDYMTMKQEIKLLKETRIISELRQYSASERIMAVSQIEGRPEMSPELTKTLINTLNSDESASVRYAALQALKNYSTDDLIRAELVKSLELQHDPLIQISLISLLLEISEKSAVVPIREILNREKTTPEVKEQAKIALKILV